MTLIIVTLSIVAFAMLNATYAEYHGTASTLGRLQPLPANSRSGCKKISVRNSLAYTTVSDGVKKNIYSIDTRSVECASMWTSNFET